MNEEEEPSPLDELKAHSFRLCLHQSALECVKWYERTIAGAFGHTEAPEELPVLQVERTEKA